MDCATSSTMKYRIGKRLVVTALVIITSLLGLNIYLTHRNGIIMENNRRLHEESENIKTAVSHIAIDLIHNIDLGMRSYALFKHERYLYPFNIAQERKDSIFDATETMLRSQGYPALGELKVLRDSVDSYFALNQYLKVLIDSGQTGDFFLLADQDRGYQIWLQFERFEKSVHAFENRIQSAALERLTDARFNNTLLQFVLFFICIPTLLFTAWQTFKSFAFQRQVRALAIERANFFKSQSEILEKRVQERTEEINHKNRELQERSDEITAQNEEIKSQNEQLVSQQDQILLQRDLLTEHVHKLGIAQETILKQQQEIQLKNESLEVEVERKTKELVLYNQQLEQFAFVSAHNLRAPVARILGLGNILRYIKDNPEEAQVVIDSIVKASHDLDVVIRDLTSILEIKSNINAPSTEVVFADEISLIKANLERELVEASCVIEQDFQVPTLVTVKPYMDSILFNLVSNAIKYRCPEKPLRIKVRTSFENDFFCLEVSDNALGIDLEKYGKDLFSIYKRFHTHVEGKGLGLHLVKMQVQALGGFVEVTSNPGVGSSFKIFLKLHAEPLPVGSM